MKLQGTLDDHYHMLPAYVAELKKANRNGTFELVLDRATLDSLVRFKRLYICFDSIARGFREGCRRVIGLDGCFLKTELKGQLLSVVGKDGNNQMFPIAWAVVEGENLASWTWFIQLLMNDLGNVDGNGWTIISDQQKYTNRLVLSNIVQGLENAVSAYISKDTKCEVIDNNICECFKNYIIQARSKPIIDMLEEIRGAVMQRVEDNKKKSRTCTLRHAGKYQFEVTDLGSRFVVDLLRRTCSCRYWEIRGIPCPHAITCIHWIKEDPVIFVSEWLKKDVYQLAYSYGIPPMNGQNLWSEADGSYVFPPLVRKQPGRPKLKRRIDVSEKEPMVQRLSKKGVHMKCSLCHQVGHNRKTCTQPRIEAGGQVRDPRELQNLHVFK
ncbi:uncharacterized protein LOC144707369 [Wolffia australiana]